MYHYVYAARPSTNARHPLVRTANGFIIGPLGWEPTALTAEESLAAREQVEASAGCKLDWVRVRPDPSVN